MPNTPPIAPAVIEIKGVVQKYAWGKKGNTSRVGMLSGEGAQFPDTPFAEMWFGAHASSPSPILPTHLTPLEVTAEDLFQFVSLPGSTFTAPLPFLMKILSVGAPLSIQLHPDKSNAERLHDERPGHYPDANYKPELAVALSEVELLCGIRPVHEINEIVKAVPALTCLVPSTFDEHSNSNEVIEIFRSLFNLKEIDRRRIVEGILSTHIGSPLLLHHQRWIREAATKNSLSDPGLIGILLLNHISLSPGECVFIAPGIPHAYMSGDLVECMASSDNVVRAGLTEKFIDIPTFLQLVRYDPLMNPRLEEETGKENFITFFSPPVPDFKLTRIRKGALDLSQAVTTPAIIMCQSGEGTLTQEKKSVVWRLQAGKALFVSHIDGPLILSGADADIFIASANNR